MSLSLLSVALLLAACGSPEEEATNESTTSSTQAAPDTTGTTAASTTTTVASTTSTDSTSDGSESLLASLGASAEVTSARIEGSFDMTGLDAATAGVSDATILFSAAFDSNTGDSSFLMDMSSFAGAVETDDSDPFAAMAAGMFGNMEVREIGDTAYVKFPFFTAMFGAETEWVSMPAEEAEGFTGDFAAGPMDPGEMMETFDEEGASIEVVGTEDVNGVEATHYRVSLDLEEMDLTAEEEAELAESGVFPTGEIPLEIWISEDGFMVRMIMVIDGSGLASSPEDEFETMTIRYDLFDINGDVVIEAPPAAEVTSMDDLESGFSFEP